LLIAAHKGGYVVALNPTRRGEVVWRRLLAPKPGDARGEIGFGGASDGKRVYYGLNSGFIAALNVSDGIPIWQTDLMPARHDRGGISAAITIAADAVFTGAWDGVLRAYSAGDGRLLWSFDTAQPFDTVNGVAGHGGSMGAPGPVIAAGMLFVTSGYIGIGNGMPGNVLLAFAPD
jgi:polyvinyl alcohol dehydrogenase (cytochrome)